MGSTLLTTGSVLAAFFAGSVALFAPCCIVFLAPSYLAVAVKNRRWRLLPLTFVFAAGLALVLVPITLGMSLVAATIANYHQPLYYAGGLLMLALAGYSLSGRMWALPSFLRAPDTAAGDTGSFFALGVFSGVASSCCAPVLAGVMTLSALSGSPAGGVLLGLAYVFGMTVPLFLIGLCFDRFRLGERRFLQARPLRLRVGRLRLVTNTVNAAVAVTFAVMGGFVLYLANTEQMTGGPGFQVAIGRALTRAFGRVEDVTAGVPEPVLGLAVLALAAVFVVATLRDPRRRTSPGQTPDEPSDEPASHPNPQHGCHETPGHDSTGAGAIASGTDDSDRDDSDIPTSATTGKDQRP
jgi:cytochrome c-type biogenesis protein